jgi:MHS family proline/betaine transporter-like MFS transporter
MKFKVNNIILPIKETLNKNTIGSGVGTLLEWLDFSLYGYFAGTIAQVFFPNLGKTNALFATYGIFAFSSLARPIGAIIFGYIGDCYGRKQALLSSIFLMCFATVCIGILPGYEQWGVVSAILLTFFRFLQGMSIASEFMGAAIFNFEHSKKKYPYLTTSWTSSFSSIGVLIAAFFAFFVSASFVPGWGWRVPFIFSAISYLYVYFLRKTLTETPVFNLVKKDKQILKFPMITVLKYNLASVLKILIMGSFMGSYVYICNVWLGTFLVEKQYFDAHTVRLLILIGQCCVVIFTPTVALCADKFNNGNFFRIFGLLGSIIVSNLLFSRLINSSFGLAIFAQVLYAMVNSCVAATMLRYFSWLFPPNQRYSGQTLGWALSALIGGTSPLMAQFLVQWNNLFPAMYVSIIGFIAFIITGFVNKKFEKNL